MGTYVKILLDPLLLILCLEKKAFLDFQKGCEPLILGTIEVFQNFFGVIDIVSFLFLIKPTIVRQCELAFNVILGVSYNLDRSKLQQEEFLSVKPLKFLKNG